MFYNFLSFLNLKHQLKFWIFIPLFTLGIFYTQAYTMDYLLTKRNLININNQLPNLIPTKAIKDNTVLFIGFFDYQSKNCKKMQSIIPTIRKNNPKVIFIFKELPSNSESILMSKGILAAKNQGKYMALHHAIMEQENAISLNDVFKTAVHLGINLDMLKKSMRNAKIAAEINRNIYLGKTLGITDTPFFIITLYPKKSNTPPIIISKATTEKTLQDAINFFQNRGVK